MNLIKAYTKTRKVVRKSLLVVASIFIVDSAQAQQPTWLSNFELAKTAAQNTNRLILVDFWADWCGPCKKMDAEVWSTPEAERLKRNVIPVKLDIDLERALALKYGIRSIPHILVMNYKGEIVYQQIGYAGKDKLLHFLEAIPAEVGRYYEAIDRRDESQSGISLIEIAMSISFAELCGGLADQAEAHLKRALKKATGEDARQIRLYLMLSQVLNGKPQKIAEELSGQLADYAETQHASLYWYVLANAFERLSDEHRFSDAVSKLRDLPDGQPFVTKLTDTARAKGM
jgi:thioredoxin-like negative regulator of GroEL